MTSKATIYNFTAETESDAEDILLLQLEEDGLAEEYFDEYKEEWGCWRWTPAAYAINGGADFTGRDRTPLARLAHQIFRTSPVGWVATYTGGRLDEI